MKQIQVIAWCDGPHDEDEQVPATEQVTVQIDRLRPRTIDLCEFCYKDMVEPLRTTLVEFGVDPTGAPPKATMPAKPKRQRTTACPLCDQVSNSRSALGQHLKRMHSTGFRALKAEGHDI